MVRRALLSSIAAEGITTLAMLLTFRLAADAWGPTGLSEWLLARRVVTLAMPAAVFGLEIALTLAIASQVKPDAAARFLAAAMPPVALSVTLIALVTLLFPAACSTLLFGSAEYIPLLAPVVALIAALSLHVVLYAFLRGTMHFLGANVLQVVVHGALPLAAILLVGVGPRPTLLALSAAIACVVTLFSLRWLPAALRARNVLPISRDLLKNGLPRTPAAFGVLALFGVPPIAVAHADSLVNAGFLSLGMSVVTICGSAFSPLSVVLLPVAARARAERDSGALLSRVAFLIQFAVLVGVAIAVVLAFAGELMTRLLIGHVDPTLAHVFRWVGLSAAPYIYFVCARPVIDAHTSSFTITRLVIGAGVVFVAVTALCLFGLGLKPLESALCGHVCSVYALAIGVFVEFRRVVRAGAESAAA